LTTKLKSVDSLECLLSYQSLAAAFTKMNSTLSRSAAVQSINQSINQEIF